jgi:hypothetical protein
VIGLVQLTYTTLFGWYAAYVFLRTGMLAPCFLVHAYCNAMGLPDLSFLAQPAPPPSTGTPHTPTPFAPPPCQPFPPSGALIRWCLCGSSRLGW